MNKQSLAQWLERLETLHPKAMDLGLERVSTVARTLGLLPVRQPVVTVAGTNGKGSTVAVLEAVLREAGFSTGAFTSPHLLRFNERIRIAGVEASDTEITAAFAAIEQARGAVTLTYFEFAALAALFVFQEREPDIVILEVGLGGRLDAVNMVDATVAVITRIDLDHQGWLGETRAEIAREKAGILRRDRAVVVSDSEPPAELAQYIDEIAATPAYYLGRDFHMAVNQDSWEAQLRQPDGTLRRCGPFAHSAVLPENTCGALQAAILLGVDCRGDGLARALRQVAPTGRRQLRQIAGRSYFLDVAHNPASVVKMLEYIDATPCNGRTLCLFSVMADKDIGSMLDAAAGYFDQWFLADQPGQPRAAKVTDVAARLRSVTDATISLCTTLEQAFQRARSALDIGDRLVIFGSFYTVAAVIPLLDTEQRHAVEHANMKGSR